MIRPCFLVIDREFAGSISTRKLVLETAKFNVITAYSAKEAIDTLKRFPMVTGAVMDTGVTDMTCDGLVEGLRRLRTDLYIVAISSPRGPRCEEANEQLETFDPRALLAILQQIVPEATKEIEKREEELESRD